MNERRDEMAGSTAEGRTNPPAATSPRGLDPSQESAIDRMILRESAGDGARAPAHEAASDAGDARGPAATEERAVGDAVASDASEADPAATQERTDPHAVGAGDPEPPAAAPVRAPAVGRDEPPVQLFADSDTARYREQWREIQVGFVDDPRTAVDRADELVVAVLEDVRRTFAEQRSGLVRAWEAGDDVSTEDLRITLRQYRSFFHRLLSL